MKNIKDFNLDYPASLKEIVEDSVSSGEIKPPDDGIENMMQRVYEHIERQALEVYKSNEPWALKAWAYSNILKETIISEATNPMITNLIAPIREWQATQFDPLLNFKRKLEGGEYAELYTRFCMKLAGEFVNRYGKKERYTEPEILEFIDYLKKTGAKSTYATKVYRLKAFLDSLPVDNHGQRQVFPLKRLPSYPSEYYEPTFSLEELESLSVAAVLDENPQSILRLLIAQIYGVRLGELEVCESKYINLDTERPTITFLVQKRRTAKSVPVTQPIPQTLLPFFCTPLERRSRHQILADLKRICKKAGVVMPRRAGIHAIRRRVVTELWNVPSVKELALRRFIRWSTGNMGVLPKYVQQPPEATDMAILNSHPCVEWWKAFAGLVEALPQYKNHYHEHNLQQISQ